MDYRIKTFEPEATSAFGFLSDLGFLSETTPPTKESSRPTARTVTFRRPDLEVETSLVLEFGGDDAVVTTVRTLDGEYRLDPRAAHKGREMTKALNVHADQVREIVART